MEFLPYIRKPFRVEAIEVTRENIHEISLMTGDLVEEEGQEPYIQVDRKKVVNLFRIKVGFMLTRMGSNLRAYTREAFDETFSEDNEGPRLGLAMTGELLDELRARIEVDYYNGGGGLEYSTKGGRPRNPNFPL